MTEPARLRYGQARARVLVVQYPHYEPFDMSEDEEVVSATKGDLEQLVLIIVERKRFADA